MRIVKYFFVGAIAATVDIGLFSFFAVYLGWAWLPVSIATFILATFTNYFLSILFVFQSGVRYKKNQEVFGVFIISGLALLINQIILYFTIEMLELNLILSKILATGSVFFWNYFGRSRLIFKET
jgi:putative flippase GtrA